MKRSQFDAVKVQITDATAAQLLELEDVIAGVCSGQSTEMALARRTRQTVRKRTCPHCQSNAVVLHGKDKNGRQRFRCRGCRRTYNIMTGTPMARARKSERWSQYLGCMTEHMSVRKIVASGIGIHQVTAWRWRHRFLEAAANDNAAILSGVIEADETFFLWSYKGSRGWKAGEPPADRAACSRSRRAGNRGSSDRPVPVLTALDNSGRIFQSILVSLDDIEATLTGHIASGSVLCSDGKAAYVAVADEANAEHYTVSAEINRVATPVRKPGRLGLERVTHHHLCLNYLIYDCCRGVATKYLRNYLGWQRAMVRYRFEGKALLPLALA